MKRNMVPLLGIAFVAAIICTGVYYGLFAGKLKSSTEIPGHSIVVAARDLDRGTVVQASDLRVAEVPGVLTGSFSKPEAAIGATLLTPLKTDEPLLTERVVSPVSSSGSGGGMVPSGMRAVSIRVSESDGLLGALLPGSRVDLQAISERENNQVQLRNILQNVEVLSVSPQDGNNNRAAGAVVTVLARAQDADVVALSDAGGKIRVTLRNPFDPGTTVPHAMTLSAVYSNQTSPAALAAQISHEQASAAPAASSEPASRSKASTTPVSSPLAPVSANGWDHPVRLHVQVLNVSDGAFRELESKWSSKAPAGSPDPAWRVGSFGSGDDAEKLIRSLEQKHELEIVSSERLMAGVGRPISYRAGAAPYQLRVQFSPEFAAAGTLSLHVKPEISAPSGSGVATSKYDAGLPVNSSFLVESGSKDHAAERLFPGQSWEQHHLVLFVSAYPLPGNSTVVPGNSTVAVARTGKGR